MWQHHALRLNLSCCFSGDVPMRDLYPPRSYQGVMVSGTFTDLVAHRQAVIEAIERQDLFPIAMEHDGAKAGPNVIRSSLEMVRDGAAYIGVISHKYGQTPKCPKQNPDRLSITELEFNEARRLDRPILLFIMGEEHPVLPRDVEQNSVKKRKLKAFQTRAKRMREDSEVERVYEVFNSLEHFAKAALNAVAKLRRYLDEQSRPEDAPQAEAANAQERASDAIPHPPDLFAVPRYAGSHAFVGRASQLETLTDWASAADPHPVLLYEAIGGSGKSILTWEWVNQLAPTARDDWAGRFWYSFYEKGAVMVEFCRQALAYMNAQPVDAFRREKTPELTDMLITELNARPWLVVLDGLERVLVAYNRFDAAQLRDEEADTAGDQIADRDPCAAIRSEDDELLRKLAAAAPSKLLMTSRLTPRALLNPSGMPLPGVRRDPLPGLRPQEAVEMIRACEVTGTSETIRAYLQENCDCHPLVIGVLAGLINDYLPDRGNFDKWTTDPAYGGRLNLAELDLVSRRNHILEAAFDALSETSRQLHSTLALLYSAVDYETLNAFNPHLPSKPEEVPEPANPEESMLWDSFSDEEKSERKTAYEQKLHERRAHLKSLEAWSDSDEVRAAPSMLAKTVRDLERRGLLQYDAREKRYDLHPVVRGVAAGRMRNEEKETLGQRLVDHFSQQTHDPYEQAETLQDVAIGLQLVRGLLEMGRFQDAYNTLHGELADALVFNLEANAEMLALLRPFFSDGWSSRIEALNEREASYIGNFAGILLYHSGRYIESLDLYSQCIQIDHRMKDWRNVQVKVNNVANTCFRQGRLAAAERLGVIARDFAELMDEEKLFKSRCIYFALLVELGRIPEAEAEWRRLDPMGRDWSRSLYRPGDAEQWFAEFRYRYSELRDEDLIKAENLAREGRARHVIRQLHHLRGRWHLKRGEIASAVESLREAVRMTREFGGDAPGSEALLALAKLRARDDAEARVEAERLSAKPDESALAVAELWRALGHRDKAMEHALRAHRWAVADGEPYVYRYQLDQARALLEDLGVEPPKTPRYDPSKDEPFPWEKDVVAALEALRAEKLKENAKEN